MAADKNILLSGVKPTGKPHIGNYFGAMKQFVDLQDDYTPYIFIADYHALTTEHNPERIREDIVNVAIDYLAIGLDPDKVLLYKQSDIPPHMELAWIFNCITTMPYLMRAHAFKDAEARNKEISVGTFEYPLLMAADILLYDPDVVPVGQDQKQHVEITRDTAEKFNHLFGETFKLPGALILEDVAVVPGIDGQKMSKSYGNTIPLFAEDSEIEGQVMAIVTDSKGTNEPKDPEQCNIFALHKLFSTAQLPDLEKRYCEGSIGYKESKEILMANIKTFIAPLREKRAALAGNRDEVLAILKRGGEIAREQSEKKMDAVRKNVGVQLY